MTRASCAVRRLWNGRSGAYSEGAKETGPGALVTPHPDPDRPHLSERGSAVGSMPSSETVRYTGPRGWTAKDLTPHDVAPLLDNFITKFEPGKPDECWLWRGTKLASGYGVLGRSYLAALLAHRVSWVAFTGRALTGDLTIDHLCANRSCVNPDHLEPVTLQENIRRHNERARKEGPR